MLIDPTHMDICASSKLQPKELQLSVINHKSLVLCIYGSVAENWWP